MSKKHEHVYLDLKAQISQGLLAPGTRLPPERELMERYQVSRPTVRHALSRLVDDGLITRRVGSGTYVNQRLERPDQAVTLGLLIPNLGKGEIFEPICARIAELSQIYNYRLTWGASAVGSGGEAIIRAAHEFVAQRVNGVFVRPLELVKDAAKVNRAMIEILAGAGIPIVLLDADYLPFPERSPHDLVGIDNIHAAYTATKHLLSQGARRVDLVWRPYTAHTLHYRRAAYRQALLDAGITPQAAWEHELDPEDLPAVQQLCDSGATDLLVANDETAALLMQSLAKLRYSCPSDIRIVGFDDVKYARLVRVPLTTVRQPCDDIGEAAVHTLLSRIKSPDLPPRTVLIQGQLIVRSSSIRPN